MYTSEHQTNPSKSIKFWAEDDRPREKLLLKGKQNLSNSELLAILIGTGTKNNSALDLAKKILESCDQNLVELSRSGISKLKSFSGIGAAKAITIEAALELGRRRQQSDVLIKPIIKTSSDAYQILRPLLEDLNHEEFWILYLDRKNSVLQQENISKGGMSATVVDTRIIFKKALEYKAVHLVLAHNHPSGNLFPSQSDIDLTKRLKSAGEIMEINVIDHLIICPTKYYSFADEGKL